MESVQAIALENRPWEEGTLLGVQGTELRPSRSNPVDGHRRAGESLLALFAKMESFVLPIGITLVLVLVPVVVGVLVWKMGKRSSRDLQVSGALCFCTV